MSFAGPLLLIELRVDGETSVPIFKRGSVCVCVKPLESQGFLRICILVRHGVP